MIIGRRGYQRRYLRAPLKQKLLYADAGVVHLARCLNVSEDGLLLDELPAFPDGDEVPLMVSVPFFPQLKSLDLNELKTLSHDDLEWKIFRARARLVRKSELAVDLDHIFKSRFGLQFTRLHEAEREVLANYVAGYASNIVHLQALIDSYNSNQEARERCRPVARLLGYDETAKIAQLRKEVAEDYQGLQWL